jgi:predicted DNA binding CopG/RHH family protein
MAKKRSAPAYGKQKRARGRPKLDGPVKRIIAIRIAPGLLTNLKKLASKRSKPYQTLIHEILEKAVSEAK